MRELVEKAEGAVVRIICFDIGSTGSGFFVTPDGYLVTNHHVVSRQQLKQGLVSFAYSQQIYVQLNGEHHPARIVSDTEGLKPIVYDYSILKVDLPNPVPYLPIGDPSDVRSGDEVLCFGYPLDFEKLITTFGVIAAIDRRPSHFNALFQINTFVTDTVIQFGNSGGPMVHVPSGTAIGINTLKHPFVDGELWGLRLWAGDGASKVSEDLKNIATVLQSLINITARYADTGLNHAVSIEHVIGDNAWPIQGAEGALK